MDTDRIVRRWHKANVAIDPTALPHNERVHPDRAGAIFGLIFAVVWLGASLSMIVSGTGGDDVTGFGKYILYLFPLFGIAVLVGIVKGGFKSYDIDYATDGVTVKERNLGSKRSWRARYDEFIGVVHGHHVVHRRNAPDIEYQVVALMHPDPAKSVPLMARRGRGLPRRDWEDYCRAFDLPGIEFEGDEMIRRDSADLDKTVKELVAEGKISAHFDHSRPPPEGLLLSRHGEGDRAELVIEIRTPRLPTGLATVLPIVPLIFVLIGTTAPDAFPFAVFGIVLSLATVGIVLFDRRNPRIVRLDRTEIRIIDKFGTLFGSTVSALRLNEIEGVRETAIRTVKAVRIEGDRGYIRVGAGLNPRQIEWLRGFLTSAMATA